MKKKWNGILHIISLSVSVLTYGQVGINTVSPAATLDIVAEDPTNASSIVGVIAPRLTGDELMAKDAVYLAAQTGTIVYVITATTAPSAKTINVTEAGYYFFDGTLWQHFASSTDTSKWTNNPTDTRVELTNLSDGSTARTSGTEFVIGDDGDVGIGATEPLSNSINTAFGSTGLARLEISKSSDASGPLIHGVAEDSNIIGNDIVLSNFSNLNDPSGLVFSNSRGTIASPLALQQGDAIGAIVFAGRTSTSAAGSYSTMGATYQGDGTTDLASFFINVAGITNAFRIREETGNVGIGNAVPRSKLDVNGYIRVGSSDITGDATPMPGMMRYNSSTSTFEGYVADTGFGAPGWVALH